MSKCNFKYLLQNVARNIKFLSCEKNDDTVIQMYCSRWVFDQNLTK